MNEGLLPLYAMLEGILDRRDEQERTTKNILRSSSGRSSVTSVRRVSRISISLTHGCGRRNFIVERNQFFTAVIQDVAQHIAQLTDGIARIVWADRNKAVYII